MPNDREEFISLLSTDEIQERSSSVCLANYVGWLNTCFVERRRCLRKLDDRHHISTPVINVGNGSASPPLVIAEKNQIGRWAALSYCWGGDFDFKLIINTIDDFHYGSPLGEFPRTVKNAIIITRSLGLHYLWVDAWCIIAGLDR